MVCRLLPSSGASSAQSPRHKGSTVGREQARRCCTRGWSRAQQVSKPHPGQLSFVVFRFGLDTLVGRAEWVSLGVLLALRDRPSTTWQQVWLLGAFQATFIKIGHSGLHCLLSTRFCVYLAGSRGEQGWIPVLQATYFYGIFLSLRAVPHIPG